MRECNHGSATFRKYVFKVLCSVTLNIEGLLLSSISLTNRTLDKKRN